MLGFEISLNAGARVGSQAFGFPVTLTSAFPVETCFLPLSLDREVVLVGWGVER